MSQIFMMSELISSLFIQETDVSANPFSTSVHQQPGASGSEQQAASLSVTKTVADVECWELQGNCSRVLTQTKKSLLKGK